MGCLEDILALSLCEVLYFKASLYAIRRVKRRRTVSNRQMFVIAEKMVDSIR
jgi:hypothetical protein